MKSNGFAWLLGFLAVLGMAGCVVPGQRVDVSDYGDVETLEEQSVDYKLMRISPGLLRELRREPRAEAVGNAVLVDALRNYEYTIGPQDVLSFTVWDHPELTIPAGEFRSAEIQGHLVSSEGKIFFPYVGEVDVEDRTLVAIRNDVTRRLAKFINEPQLDVRVADFRSKKINVTGEVQNPGFFPITDVPMTLVEALTLAGGDKPQAALQRVQVVRDGRGQVFDVQALLELGDMRQNLLLQDGDVVYVPENSFDVVHMLGAVKQAGAVSIMRGRLNLAEAITRSGGFDETNSDPGRVLVFRGSYEAPEVFWLDAKSPDAMLLATQFEMQPQDVVYVASTGLARWNRLISQILPTVQTLWQTQSLINRLESN